MSQQEQAVPIQIAEISDFGPGNGGDFGPSDSEIRALEDLSEERYWGPSRPESGCMDDRLEGLRVQMAGNRAVTEVVAEYMDRHLEATPQSRALARKINELITMGRMPVFHLKCAALAKQRDVLVYNTQNPDAVVDSAWSVLEALGSTEFLTQQQLKDAIKIGGQRAQDEDLWDASAEELYEIAAENGAVVEDTPGEHHVAANLNNLSENGFNNEQFKTEHQADDGEPLGLLVVSYAAYRKQLLEDGFSEADTAKKLMRAALFNVGTQKAINKDGSPVITVTNAH